MEVPCANEGDEAAGKQQRIRASRSSSFSPLSQSFQGTVKSGLVAFAYPFLPEWLALGVGRDVALGILSRAAALDHAETSEGAAGVAAAGSMLGGLSTLAPGGVFGGSASEMLRQTAEARCREALAADRAIQTVAMGARARRRFAKVWRCARLLVRKM